MSGTLRVRNWGEFQHYKRRNPPWIKLHRKLLDNREYQLLEDGPARLLFDLWLVASESDDGSIPFDSAALAWRLRRPVQEIRANLQVLIRSGFIVATGHDASNVLALRLHDAPPEAERETETDLQQATGKPDSAPEHGVGARLLTEPDRDALTAVLAKSPSPAHVVAELTMILDGGRPNVSRDPAHIGLALCDYAANEHRWSNDLFRRYVQRAAKGERPPGHGKPNPGAQGYANALGGGR